jgi:hypothetical protein
MRTIASREKTLNLFCKTPPIYRKHQSESNRCIDPEEVFKTGLVAGRIFLQIAMTK